MHYSLKLGVLSFFVITTATARINQITNQQELERVIGHDKVMLEIYSPACSICKNIEKSLEYVADQAESQGIHFARVDAKNNPDLVKSYKIRSYPTFIFLSKGQEIARQSGVYNTKPDKFKEEMKALLNKIFS